LHKYYGFNKIYSESQPIKCIGIGIKAFSNVFPKHYMCYPLKTVHNKCMLIGNHAIKVLYNQCNMKSWFLANALPVICYYYSLNKVT